jgi:hypothetical protein
MPHGCGRTKIASRIAIAVSTSRPSLDGPA